MLRPGLSGLSVNNGAIAGVWHMATMTDGIDGTGHESECGNGRVYPLLRCFMQSVIIERHETG
jgi:hypothetical protein